MPPAQQTLAQAQASIKQQLTAQKQQKALSELRQRTSSKSGPTRTDCRADYVVQDCKQYKAPKTPTTATPATPTTTTPQTGTRQRQHRRPHSKTSSSGRPG